MKHIHLLYFVIFGLFLSSIARPVDVQTVQSIASKFMVTNDLQLVSTYQTAKNAAAFYVFNTTNGFVIVSADDCETPIIAYSHEGRFDPDNVPVQMQDYLQDFTERIQYGIENHIAADELTARQWELVKSTGRINESKSTKAVAPLLTEKWHQGCRYNSLCPTMSGPCGHAEVGCVAVAMGQIMHYWKYPTTGWDSHSYSNAGVTLSADFGNTTYDWDHMPDSLTEASSEAEIEAVATLLYHCGVALDMNYSANGSSTDSNKVPNALKRYFNYSRYLHREKKGNDNAAWLALLKNDLDLQRPVLYSGRGNGSHAFVCDGYDDNDLLHFNWGWGTANGYFALGNINPIGYDFSSNNYAIFGIDPHYEPYTVTATAYPPYGGTIEGTGEYHLSELCTLTAIPTESSQFNYWKRGGGVVSYDRTYSFTVNDDIDDIEAYFSFHPVKEITATHAPDTNDVNSPYINLLWSFDDNHVWPQLKQILIDDDQLSVTTDGEFIYTLSISYDSLFHPTSKLRKYTMDGELLEFCAFNFSIPNITCDGNYLYFANNSIYSEYLYCTDFNTIIDSINVGFRPYHCAYDAENDGFWLSNSSSSNSNIVLVNRQGQRLCDGPRVTTLDIGGLGSIIAEDGNPHLLVFNYIPTNFVRDYDISRHCFNTNLAISLNLGGRINGACIGKYDGKDALFVAHDQHYSDGSSILIFEINSHFAPIMHYRLYRSDSEGNTITLADEASGTSFVDSTWNEAQAGIYRFGISHVYFNGVESEIIWSDAIEKTDYGIEENDSQEVPKQQVQKVFEDGKIVIIKNGKRYTVTGQLLN